MPRASTSSNSPCRNTVRKVGGIASGSLAPTAAAKARTRSAVISVRCVPDFIPTLDRISSLGKVHLPQQEIVDRVQLEALDAGFDQRHVGLVVKGQDHGLFLEKLAL